MTYLPRYALLAVLLAGAGGPAANASGDTDAEALLLGEQVMAVRHAIRYPESAGAMEAVRTLGLDSRYYTMVRGWLALQLQGDEQILAAAGENAPADVTARVEFLKKAIRAIDLE